METPLAHLAFGARKFGHMKENARRCLTAVTEIDIYNFLISRNVNIKDATFDPGDSLKRTIASLTTIQDPNNVKMIGQTPYIAYINAADK